MLQKTWKVQFSNPAFLGNAEQKGQWRTPPFKALLRQWWRIFEAQEVNYQVQRLREREGELFGTAGDGDAMRSKVRIRLGSWRQGRLRGNSLGAENLLVNHPEVGRGGNGMNVGSKVYLGYGPVDSKNRLKNGVAISPKEKSDLRVQVPESIAVDEVIQLIHWFGTIGGRSRNGWGSLLLEGDGVESFDLEHPLLQQVSRDWRHCLQLDWPHAIGSDENGLLIWETGALDSWESVMQRLAEIKINFRTQFQFSTGGARAQPEDRHVLAYPVTNHQPRNWKDRIANQIRFKVVKDDGKFKGRIVHIPCSVPAFANTLQQRQEVVWQQVHNRLDRLCGERTSGELVK